MPVPHRSSSFRSLLRHLLAALIAALVVPAGLLAAGPAHAAETEPSTWSVQPALADGSLDQRPHFAPTVAPGQTQLDFVAISNHSAKPLTLALSAADAYNTDSGEFGLHPSSQAPTEVGAWVTLKQTSVTIPARSRTAVPFSLTVPRDATPGDHAGGIVAALSGTAGTSDSGRVALEQRVGTRIYLRVPGEVRAELAIAEVRTTYRGTANPAGGGNAEVTYTVRNDGNVRLTGSREVRVAGQFGLGARTVDAGELPELLPGEAATYTERIDGVRPWGRITGTVTIRPQVVGAMADPGSPEVSGSGSTWALPWAGLLVLLALAGIGAGARALRGRQRARRAAEVERAVAAARAEERADAAERAAGEQVEGQP